MRQSKPVVLLLASMAVMGAVHASSSTVLRISMTIVDRCDIGAGQGRPAVACSSGTPWTIAGSAHAVAGEPSVSAVNADSRHLPVPAGGPGDARVTTIVF